MNFLGAFIQRGPATVQNPDDTNVAPRTTQEIEITARSELLRQIATSEGELESQLADLRHSAAGNEDRLHNGQARLHQLNSLRDQLVGGAKGGYALRAEIASAVAATHAYALSVSGVVGTPQTSPAEQAAQAALHDASIAAHRTVDNFERDFYGRKIFDPYLKFASAEDEDAYRHREDEYRRAIEAARAQNTPEGNLRATELAMDQLKDAGAHGADRSAEYKGLEQKLAATHDRLVHAMAGARDPERSARTEQRDSVKPDPKVSPEILAALREAGVTVADQNGSGPGVNGRARPADRSVQPA